MHITPIAKTKRNGREGEGFAVHEDLIHDELNKVSFLSNVWKSVDFTSMTANYGLSKISKDSIEGYVNHANGVFDFSHLSDHYYMKLEVITTTVTGTELTFGYGFDDDNIIQEHKTVMPTLNEEKWSIGKDLVITDNTTPLKLYLKFSNDVDIHSIRMTIAKLQEKE